MMSMDQREDFCWINELPDALLVDVLSLLPMKQAVQTSILARRWKHLWKSIHNVELLYNGYWRPLEFQNPAACAMETFLRHCQVPKIRRFHVQFPARRGNEDKVKSWILFALNHGVEKLLVDFSPSTSGYDVCKIPCSVIQSQWLIELRLTSCEVEMPSSVCLPLLKTLVLKDLKVNATVVGFIISKCPSLETLSIRQFFCRERLVISCGNSHFRSLTVQHYGQIVIDAPTVQSLQLRGDLFNARNCLLKNLSHLVRVYFNFYEQGLSIPGYVDGLMKMLNEIRHVRSVKLSEDCIRALSMTRNPGPIMATCLELVISLTTTTMLRKTRTVLSFFPGAETLILVFKGAEQPLTRQKCWKSLKHSISKQLQHIKTIVMHEFISCRSTYQNWTVEDIWPTCEVKIELVRDMLETSTCLEKVAITLSGKQEFNEWEGKPQFKLKLTEKLQIFKRASPVAKIFVY